MRAISKLLFLSLILLLTGCQRTLDANTANKIIQDCLESKVEVFPAHTMPTPKHLNHYFEDLGVTTRYEKNKIEATTLKATLSHLQEELENKAYLQSSYHHDLKEGYNYHQDGYIYTDNQKRVEHIEEALKTLDYHTTINLSFENATILPINHQSSRLSNGPFQLNIGDYRVSGRILKNGIDLDVFKKDVDGYQFRNSLTLTNVSLTADMDLKNKRHGMRLDYDLNNTTSLKKDRRYHLANKNPQFKSLKQIEDKLSRFLEPPLKQTLNLLKIEVPVPQSGNMVRIELLLQLRFRLHGEVGLELVGSSRDGYHQSREETLRIKKNNFKVTPYMEGSGELSCGIGADVYFGKYRLSDVGVEAGAGASATTQLAYVNNQEKTVTYRRYDYSLSSIGDQIGEVDSKESYVDLCADVNVYIFTRLNVNKKDTSLLGRVGLDASFTPFKKTLPLMHIENRAILKKCSHHYTFDEDLPIKETLVLSAYQVFLEPEDTFTLTTSKANGKVQWSSSDASICSVYEGHLKAKKKGRVAITATDKTGQKAVCNVVILTDEKPEFTPLNGAVNSFFNLYNNHSFYGIMQVECDFMRIIFGTGGTGGHLYPALALCRYIQKQDPTSTFLFVGTKDRLEAEVVPQLGYDYKGLDLKGIVGNPIQKGMAVLKFMASIRQSKKIIKDFKPDIVVGFGGYPSSSIVMAASKLGIKTLIHEQNSIVGLANKILLKHVDKVVCCYEKAKEVLPLEKTLLLGNPRASEVVEGDFLDITTTYQLNPNKKTVLIVMGSLGSASVNQVIVEAKTQFKKKDYQVIFVSGKKDYDHMKKALGNLPEHFKLVPYVQDMPSLYNGVDLVVCRAGASTLAEITSLGKASLIIPSPYVASNHQEYNARALYEKQAALMILEKDLTANLLVESIDAMMEDDKKRISIATHAKALGTPNASRDIYNEMKKLVGEGSI